MKMTAVALLLCLLLIARSAWALTFMVNNNGDAIDALPGDCICLTAGLVCTARAASNEVNACAGGPHTVTFSAEFTITLGAQLDFTMPSELRCDSVAGSSCTSTAQVFKTHFISDGSAHEAIAVTGPATGFVMRGCEISGMNGPGLTIASTNADAAIACNFIHTNTGQNIRLGATSNATIGGASANDANILTGATGEGIAALSSQGTIIRHNHIGFDKTGLIEDPNTTSIALEGADDSVVSDNLIRSQMQVVDDPDDSNPAEDNEIGPDNILGPDLAGGQSFCPYGGITDNGINTNIHDNILCDTPTPTPTPEATGTPTETPPPRGCCVEETNASCQSTLEGFGFTVSPVTGGICVDNGAGGDEGPIGVDQDLCQNQIPVFEPACSYVRFVAGVLCVAGCLSGTPTPAPAAQRVCPAPVVDACLAASCYTGNGGGVRSIATGLPAPALLIVSRKESVPDVSFWRTEDMAANTSCAMVNLTTQCETDRIRSMGNNSFEVGAGFNQLNVNYCWYAFRDTPGHFEVFAYDGDANNPRTIPTDFDPEMCVMQLADGNSAFLENFFWVRTNAMPTNVSFPLAGNVATFGQTNLITNLTTGGFVTGAGANELGKRYRGWCWRGGAGYGQVLHWVGTGSAGGFNCANAADAQVIPVTEPGGVHYVLFTACTATGCDGGSCTSHTTASGWRGYNIGLSVAGPGNVAGDDFYWQWPMQPDGDGQIGLLGPTDFTVSGGPSAVGGGTSLDDLGQNYYGFAITCGHP